LGKVCYFRQGFLKIPPKDILMASGKVTFCPKCLKPVEAKEYVSTGGMSDWRAGFVGASTTIVCSKCGYTGLPLQAGMKEYEKLIKKKK